MYCFLYLYIKAEVLFFSAAGTGESAPYTIADMVGFLLSPLSQSESHIKVRRNSVCAYKM